MALLYDAHVAGRWDDCKETESNKWRIFSAPLHTSRVVAVVMNDKIVVLSWDTPIDSILECPAHKVILDVMTQKILDFSLFVWSKYGDYFAFVEVDNSVSIYLSNGQRLCNFQVTTFEPTWKSDVIPCAIAFRQTVSKTSAAGSRPELLVATSHSKLLRLKFPLIDDPNMDVSSPIITNAIRMSSPVQCLKEWHQGITSMVYDFQNNLLAIAGGVSDSNTSSSLTIWSLEDQNEPFYELYHYTITILTDQTEKNEKKPNFPLSFLYHLLTFIGYTPQKLLSSGNIVKLNFSPNSLYLFLLSKDGYTSIREVETLSEMATYSPTEEMKRVMDMIWWTDDSLLLITKDGKINIAHLTSDRKAILTLQEEYITTEDLNGSCMSSLGKQDTFLLKEASSSWVLSAVTSTTPQKLYHRKCQLKEYNSALEIALTHDLNADIAHQSLWLQSSFTKDDLQKHLTRIKDVNWVLHECCNSVPGSYEDVKNLLQYGMRLLNSPDALQLTEQVIAPFRKRLLKYIDRLDTFLLLIECEVEDHSNTSLFNHHDFETFRDCILLKLARGYALQGRLRGLSILFDRYGYSLLPFRLEILENIPATISPHQYKMYLPAIPTLPTKSSLETTPTGTSTQDAKFFHRDLKENIKVLPMRPGNRMYDMEIAYNDVLMASVHQQDTSIMTTWFKERILSIDAVCGNLHGALELALLALDRCNKNEEMKQLLTEVTFLDRLVYSVDVDTTIRNWLDLNPYKRLETILNGVDETTVVARLEDYFIDVVNRSDDMQSKEWFDALQLYLVNLSRNTATGLNLVAAVIQASNPLIPIEKRIIRGGVRLLDIAIESIYSCRDIAQLEAMDKIFQCLPERDATEEKKNQRFALLQIQVDDMEAHLQTAEIMLRYGVSVPMKVFLDASAQVRKSGERNESDDDEESIAQQLLRRVCICFTRQKKASSRSPKEWQNLLDDLFAIRDQAFSWIDLDFIIEMVVTVMLTANAFDVARRTLVQSEDKALDMARAERVVVKAAQENFNSASSGSHALMEAAKECLKILTPSKTHPLHAIANEYRLIEAVTLLDALGVHVPPLQVRLSPTRMDFIDRALKTNPSAYHIDLRDFENFTAPGAVLLHLGKYLGLNSFEDLAKIKTKCIYAAYRAGDFDAVYTLSLELLDDGLMEPCLISLVVDVIRSPTYHALYKRRQLCGAVLSCSIMSDVSADEILGWWQQLDALCDCYDLLKITRYPLSDIADDGSIDLVQEEFCALAVVATALVDLSSSHKVDNARITQLMQAGLRLKFVMKIEAAVDDVYDLSRKTFSLNHEGDDRMMPLAYFLASSSSETIVEIVDGLAVTGKFKEKAVLLAERYFSLEVLSLSGAIEKSMGSHNCLQSDIYGLSLLELRARVDKLLSQGDYHHAQDHHDQLDGEGLKGPEFEAVQLAKKYRALVSSSQQLRTLQSSISNVNVDMFSKDQTYRKEKVLEIAKSSNEEDFLKAIKLAAEYEIDEWEVVFMHIRWKMYHDDQQLSLESPQVVPLENVSEILGSMIHTGMAPSLVCLLLRIMRRSLRPSDNSSPCILFVEEFYRNEAESVLNLLKMNEKKMLWESCIEPWLDQNALDFMSIPPSSSTSSSSSGIRSVWTLFNNLISNTTTMSSSSSSSSLYKFLLNSCCSSESAQFVEKDIIEDLKKISIQVVDCFEKELMMDSNSDYLVNASLMSMMDSFHLLTQEWQDKLPFYHGGAIIQKFWNLTFSVTEIAEDFEKISLQLLESASTSQQFTVLIKLRKVFGHDPTTTESFWKEEQERCIQRQMDGIVSSSQSKDDVFQEFVSTNASQSFWKKMLLVLSNKRETNLLMELYKGPAYDALEKEDICSIVDTFKKQDDWISVFHLSLLTPYEEFHTEIWSHLENVVLTDLGDDVKLQWLFSTDVSPYVMDAFMELILLRFSLPRILSLTWLYKLVVKSCVRISQKISMSSSLVQTPITSTIYYVVCSLTVLKLYPQAEMLLCCYARLHPQLCNIQTGHALLHKFLISFCLKFQETKTIPTTYCILGLQTSRLLSEMALKQFDSVAS